MEKLVYLLTRGAEVAGAELRESLVGSVASALRAGGASRISVDVDDEHVESGAGVAIRRSQPPIRALVSFWMENSDDREACEAALRPVADDLWGYLVVESRPQVHVPPIGERAPGANLVTCIKRKPGLETAAFIDLWNNEHRKVALEIQSTFGYVRNAVVRRLTATGFDWDGIVEESFPIEALSDPHVWYDCASEQEYRARLARMMESVTAFLDLGVLETMPMSEYYLGPS